MTMALEVVRAQTRHELLGRRLTVGDAAPLAHRHLEHVGVLDERARAEGADRQAERLGRGRTEQSGGLAARDEAGNGVVVEGRRDDDVRLGTRGDPLGECEVDAPGDGHDPPEGALRVGVEGLVEGLDEGRAHRGARGVGVLDDRHRREARRVLAEFVHEAPRGVGVEEGQVRQR